MANHPNRHPPAPTAIPAAIQAPVTPEPEVHRWPHPIPQPFTPVSTESTLHYIRCALSYQNELLNEIKSLLEQLVCGQEDGKEN